MSTPPATLEGTQLSFMKKYAKLLFEQLYCHEIVTFSTLSFLGRDNKELEASYQQLQAEMESERQHHQRLVKEHNRLLQRFENMQGEMQVLTSPLGHKRTPSDISMISLESVTSSVSPEEKKDGEEGEKEVMWYNLMLITEFRTSV